MSETEDALRAEVPVVCRAYCAQTWEKVLNRAGIDFSLLPYKFPNKRKQPLLSFRQLRMLNFKILPLSVNKSMPKKLIFKKAFPR